MYYILKKGKPDGHGAIRSITRTAFHAVAGGSATIPLAGAPEVRLAGFARGYRRALRGSGSKYAGIKYLLMRITGWTAFLSFLRRRLKPAASKIKSFGLLDLNLCKNRSKQA